MSPIDARTDQSELPASPAAVFLFDAKYRTPALNAVLVAMLQADTDREAGFEMHQGSLYLHDLAYTISGVERRPGVTFTRQKADPDLYNTLIWDFCDSLERRWHSLALDLLPEKLGCMAVAGVGLSALDRSERSAVDGTLQSAPHYLGGFEPDLGNPVHRNLIAALIYVCDYQGGALLFEPWDDEDPVNPSPLSPLGQEWFDDLPLTDARYKTESELRDDDFVPAWPIEALSFRGEQSLHLLQQRSDRGHLGEVATVISRPGLVMDGPPISIDVSAMANPADAVIEKRKLTEYALNPDHEDGGDKARWFLAALGIGRQDWRHLGGQLRLGLPGAPLEDLRSTDFGLRYSVVTTVSGLNGAMARVKSVWEVRAQAAPRLVTAYPAKREEDPPGAPPALVLSSSLEGSDRWSALWQLADDYAAQAASTIIPTPINVDGQWYTEGASGVATVGVRDARRGFARWLRQTGRAHLAPKRGAVMHAPESTIDRARAYAEAFVEVLSLNGIAANVKWHLAG